MNSKEIWIHNRKLIHTYVCRYLREFTSPTVYPWICKHFPSWGFHMKALCVRVSIKLFWHCIPLDTEVMVAFTKTLSHTRFSVIHMNVVRWLTSHAGTWHPTVESYKAFTGQLCLLPGDTPDVIRPLSQQQFRLFKVEEASLSFLTSMLFLFVSLNHNTRVPALVRL